MHQQHILHPGHSYKDVSADPAEHPHPDNHQMCLKTFKLIPKEAVIDLPYERERQLGRLTQAFRHEVNMAMEYAEDFLTELAGLHKKLKTLRAQLTKANTVTAIQNIHW